MDDNPRQRPMTDHDRMNYWWRQARAARERVAELERENARLRTKLSEN